MIDQVIEELNEEDLTDDEMYQIKDGVKTQEDEDIEKEDRERLDDDIKSFQTPEQQETLEGKDAKIQRIIEMLNQLNLSEKEMNRIENEVQRSDKENTEDKLEEKKQDGRE